MRAGMCVLAVMLMIGPAAGDATVIKRVLDVSDDAGPELLANPGFEHVEGDAVVATEPWQAGYEVDEMVSRSGERSVRTHADDPDVQHGVFFHAEIEQDRPGPVMVSGWSRAEDVSGSAGGGYSLWADIEFVDGSHQWGLNAPFDAGSHDWQRQHLALVFSKPIRSVNLYGLFRGKTGTAWFDDFSLVEPSLPRGATSFNGVPVHRDRPTVDVAEPLVLRAEGLELRLDPRTGALVDEDGGASGFFWRDVAAGSDFRQPRARLERDGEDAVLRATDEELQLALEARFSPREDHIAISGRVRDLTGHDRAISLYLGVPFDALGGTWWDDQSATRTIEPGHTYENVARTGAGPRGLGSRYPLACAASDNAGMAVAVPLDRPLAHTLAYDSDSRELYAAMHLGLAPEPERFPSAANFALQIYPVQPRWGFRDALRRYYAMHPDCFVKRNEREGQWMPFTDISTVQGWEDFGFGFHEGNNNVAFDDEAGIYSFVYCEPTGTWLPMPPEMPRTPDEAVALLRERAEDGEREAAALNSVTHRASGEMNVSVIDAPWCDGALFICNPSPHLLEDQPDEPTRARYVERNLWRAFEHAERLPGWGPYGEYEIAPEAGRDGTGAIRARAAEPGPHGAAQTVTVNQDEATGLLVSGYSRAEQLEGDPGDDWCLYVDLHYADNGHLWGQRAVFDSEREGWQRAQVRIEPERAVSTATVYAMFRGETTGSVLFDDLSITEEGADENLLRNAGFEPDEPGELDGIYIDSSEMGASTGNFRREHWRYATIPLTFNRDVAVCQLTIFNAVEFARGLARRLHEQGRMLMANSTPGRFPWLAAWCDVMGTETNWNPGGEYTPMSAATLNYRRAMSRRRPYLLLQNTVYDDFPPEEVELYFKRSVAWGVFPGFFSHNAADDPYWRRPALYNRDRPLFRRYIPVCATLSAGGWEPVTYARCDDPVVHIERFGAAADGALYLTAFNDSDEPARATITLDARSLGLREPRCVAVLPDAGEEIALREGVFAVDLGPQDVAVVKLSETP